MPYPAKEYFDAIESYAKECAERVEAGEDASDVMHEMVDGSEWIIYTSRNLAVIEHSRNEEAAWDMLGDDALAKCSNFGETVQRIAFYAMLADVSAAYYDLTVEG